MAYEAKPDSFKELMQLFSTKSPVFPNDYGSVGKMLDNHTFPEAVERLVHARVMAMPVVDATTGEMLCWFGVKDVVKILLRHFTNEELKQHDVKHLSQIKEELKSETLQSLLKKHELSPIGAWIPYSTEVKMWDAMIKMIETNQHHIAILDDKKHPDNVLSQSRCVSLLGVVVNEMPIANKTCGELKLGLGKENVYTVKESDEVRAAFALMDEHNISAVGVVNDDGKLVGNISLRDVKNFGYDARFYYLLGESCKAWCDQIRLCDPVRTVPDDMDPIRVMVDMPFSRIVSTINHYKVHRVWVVDSEDKPIGVIALTDVLRAVVDKA